MGIFGAPEQIGKLAFVLGSFYTLLENNRFIHRPNAATLYRGMSDFRDSDLQKMKPGFKFRFVSFTSASKDKNIARKFQQDNPDTKDGHPTSRSVLLEIKAGSNMCALDLVHLTQLPI